MQPAPSSDERAEQLRKLKELLPEIRRKAARIAAPYVLESERAWAETFGDDLLDEWDEE